MRKKLLPAKLISLLHAAQTRARKLRGPRSQFDLTQTKNLRRLIIRFKTGKCELTGIRFNLTARIRRTWNSPSIDRIDSSKGYTYDNVRFVLWGLNASLNSWGEGVFRLIATAYLHRAAETSCDCPIN